MSIYDQPVDHFGGQVKTANSLGVKQGTVGMGLRTPWNERSNCSACSGRELCPALLKAEIAAYVLEQTAKMINAAD